MSNRSNDFGASVDLKFDTDKIKLRVKEILNTDPVQKKAFMRHKKLKITLIAAAITLLGFATVFASGGLISYFNSDKARKIGDIETLTKYSEPIGETVTRNGKTLTLDNIAADDSYLYVFFTLTAPKDFCFDTVCRIDGESADNWANWDSYIVDENTCKGALKISVANKELPDEFNFEMYCAEKSDYNTGQNKEKIDPYYQDDLNPTEKEKNELLYISTKVHKADIKAETLTKTVNAEIPSLNSTLDKVIISPFGSQLVITQHEINRRYMSDCIVVQDENGNFIHVIRENSRICNEDNTEEVRTVPIMLSGSIPESLTIIPYGEEPEIGMIDSTEHSIENFPFELNIGGRGKVIVTDVRYLDSKLEIDYRLEGNTWGLEMICPVDSAGSNEMYSEDGVWWLNETEYHQTTESYTEVFNFVIGEADQNGNVSPAGDMRSADILREIFKSVRISYQTNTPELDYDNAVTVDLK